MSTIRLENGFFEELMGNAEEIIYTEGQDTWVRKDGEIFRKPGTITDSDTLLEQLHSVADTESWEELSAKGQSFFTITTDAGFYHATYFTEAKSLIAIFTKAKKGSDAPKIQEEVRNRAIV